MYAVGRYFYANWNCAMNLGKCCSDGKSVFCADFSVKYIRTHSALFFIRYGLAVKNGGDFDERGKQRTGICPWILLFSTLRSIAAAFTRAYVLYGFVRFVRFVRVEALSGRPARTAYVRTSAHGTDSATAGKARMMRGAVLWLMCFVCRRRANGESLRGRCIPPLRTDGGAAAVLPGRRRFRAKAGG